jgi:hypothetical protein
MCQARRDHHPQLNENLSHHVHQQPDPPCLIIQIHNSKEKKEKKRKKEEKKKEKKKSTVFRRRLCSETEPVGGATMATKVAAAQFAVAALHSTPYRHLLGRTNQELADMMTNEKLVRA